MFLLSLHHKKTLNQNLWYGKLLETYNNCPYHQCKPLAWSLERLYISAYVRVCCVIACCAAKRSVSYLSRIDRSSIFVGCVWSDLRGEKMTMNWGFNYVIEYRPFGGVPWERNVGVTRCVQLVGLHPTESERNTTRNAESDDQFGLRARRPCCCMRKLGTLLVVWQNISYTSISFGFATASSKRWESESVCSVNCIILHRKRWWRCCCLFF